MQKPPHYIMTKFSTCGNNTKIDQRGHASCSVSDSESEKAAPVDHTKVDDTFLPNEKDHSRAKFNRSTKPNGHRNNVKESKRRTWKSYNPHSEEGMKIEKDIKERNDLAHAGADPSNVLPDPSTNPELQELLKTITDSPNLFGDSRPVEVDEWIGHIENLIILGYQMSRSTSFTDVFMAVAAYAKMYTKNKSLVVDLYKIIDEVTKTCPAEDIEPQAWEGRDFMEKWSLIKNNAIFVKISYLITAAMSLTVCNIKSIEWSPMGLKLISLEAATKQVHAVDLIDALISTFVWIAEVGYQVIEQRSLAPLLYSDLSVKNFNEDCDYVLAHAETVLAGNDGDLNDLENKLDKVITRVCELKAARANGSISIWLQQKYSELVTIKQKILAKRKNTAMRFAPIGWSITGPTAVGKSTLSKLTMKTSLNAMGFSSASDRILTRDMFDKYDSTYTSDIEGVFLDDVGNNKAEFATEAITSIIIKFFNNVAAQAVKAELNLKGITFIGFKCGVLTANMKGFDAEAYSNCTESLHRRFHHVSTRIKEKYCLKGSVSINPYHPDLINSALTHDVWELDVEECVVYEHAPGVMTSRFEIMTVTLDDGEKIRCKSLGLRDYLRVVVQLSKMHAASQRNVLSRCKAFDELAMCKTCSLPLANNMCECQPVKSFEPKDLDVHSYDHITAIATTALTQSIEGYVSTFLTPVNLLNRLVKFSPIRKMATSRLSSEIYESINNTVTPFAVSMTPEWIYNSRYFQGSLNYFHKACVFYDIKPQIKRVTYSTACGLLYSAWFKNLPLFIRWSVFGWFGVVYLYMLQKRRLLAMKNEYISRRGALTEEAKSLRDGVIPKGVFVVTTLIIGLKLMKMWNASRISSLEPASLTKAAIDSQPGWFSNLIRTMGCKVGTQPVSANAETSHVCTAVAKTQFWADFTRQDGSSTRCNIIFPRKCVAWIPLHIFYKNADMTTTPTPLLEVSVTRFNGKNGIFKFKCVLDQCVIMPELDMVSCYVPNCFETRNILKWLPVTKPTGTAPCKLQVRTKNSDLSTRVISVDCGEKGHKYKNFYGGSYNTDLAQNGACMSPVIADRKLPCIIGFHIGGSTESQFGVMQTVTLSQAESAIKTLGERPGVLLSAETGDMPLKQYDIDIIESPNVHPHAMANDLKEHAYIDVLGSTSLRTKQKSEVQKSFISDSVERHCGVENQWGKPQLEPNWKGFNATLEHIIDPSEMFDPTLLERSRQDWMGELRPLMVAHCATENVAPLTDKESILGQAGVRFIDPIPMNTGMGAPIMGVKSNHFTDVYDNKGQLVDRVPSNQIVTEKKRLEDAWRRGERGYPVTTGTLKDEPTKLGKEKVRVFQAVAVAFGLCIRQKFLPIARFLHLHPLQAESAVGINAFSPQWDELMSYAHKFANDDKVIAWDYSKYDVRMSSQMTRTALLCFIELAELANYTKDDIYMMKMMVSDLVHPLIDYNGTMLMAYNMNTSGNNLTVDINSACGALYVRMGLFHAVPEATRFRDIVAVTTYGDDLTGSVAEEYRDRFNFIVFKDFLARHKMKVTLPDKSDDVSYFLNKSDADFLKRTTNYISEIGCGLGKLDEDSIFKSLHSNLRSKTASPSEVSISCIETALHEWFAFGRDHYEMRRSQMRNICDEMELAVDAVHCSFDNRADVWKSKYQPV